MYFRLGQVESAIFHDQFDRYSDTGIRFPEASRFRRDANDPNILKFEMPVPQNAIVQILPEYYTKTLGMPYYVPFNDSVFKTAPMVWSSWTSYYENVGEADIVRNTDWIANKLVPYGFQYIELDDGYDRGKSKEYYWVENWDVTKFPHGPKWLTDYIKSKVLSPGIWLVPNAYAGAVATHPDWYVRDKSSNLILDYNTPTLDSTNPEVLNFLRTMFGKLDDMGFEYYKLSLMENVHFPDMFHL
jgi:alpha-galactosidase